MELPFVGDAVNSFVSGFLSIVATLFVFAVCIGLIALVWGAVLLRRQHAHL